MNRLLVLLVILAGSSVGYAQHHGAHQSGKEKPAALISGLGSHHHPVSTANALAQKFFNQGLLLIYAFNHPEAIKSFKRAAELDPKLAMAYWGIGYASGPNINLPLDEARAKAAYEATQQALKLAGSASERERAYIEALAKRYSADTKADFRQLAVDFKNAMGEVTKRFPDDLDAATIYADSMMNLRPWKLWRKDGAPEKGTLEIVAALESVLKRNPNHIGAIHYYIHTVEASTNPERALVYAPKLGALTPAAGHLVHMPAHIYQRTGDFAAAAESNRLAALADEAYFKAKGKQSDYAMYYVHNIHFLTMAHSMQGRFVEALKAAKRVETTVEPLTKEMPFMESLLATPTLVLTRFRKWDSLLKLPEPAKARPFTKAYWHYARGLAYAAQGKVAAAEKERAAFQALSQTIPADTPYGLNTTGNVLTIAGYVLQGKMAAGRLDYKAAIDFFKQAVTVEDSLAYDEPPGWDAPARESLGAALLLSGNASEAEKIFREDLSWNPRSGRSLFGLMESLKAQGKKQAAEFVKREFEQAWQHADVKLRIEDL